MRFLGLVVLVVVTNVISNGQVRIGGPIDQKPNGQIESITYQRTYLVWKSKSVQQIPRILSIDRFHKDGSLLRSSTFGTVERRVIKDPSTSKPVYKVLYFDFGGNPISSETFSPPWEELPRQGLCNEYSTTEDRTGNV